MELKIIAPEKEQFIDRIDFNYEEIKTEIVNALEKYQGITYSLDDIKVAKDDRATLNKFKTALDNKRKDIKKKCLKPYEAFETAIKELVALIDVPIEAIGAQVAKTEDAAKASKKTEIEAFFVENVAELDSILTFDMIFNPKWLNATAKVPKVLEELQGKLTQIRQDLLVIDALNSDHALQGKDYYIRSFDLSGALREINRLTDQKKKFAEARKAIVPDPVVEKKPEPEPERRATPEITVFTKDFRVWGTSDQLISLAQFMIDNKIKYGKVGSDYHGNS